MKTLRILAVMLLAACATGASAQVRPPNYETKYARCWVDFPHAVSGSSFTDAGGHLEGTAKIGGTTYNLFAVWTSRRIEVFRKRPASSAILLDGLIYCEPQPNVTATRNCKRTRSGLGGTGVCDVCVGANCRRLTTHVTLTPTRASVVRAPQTRSD